MLALGIACTMAALAWLYLVAAHGGYWRTSQRLPRVSGEPDAWPDVVAVVPARNEAEMLPVTLPGLLGQEYPGALTVIVVDDGSSDGTGEVAARIAAGAPRPLRVVSGVPPPDGERRPGPGLADGPAAHGHQLGARRGPRLCLLLRPAVPVPPGERARLADGRRGGRLHADPPRRPGDGGRPDADPRRPHRRRGHGPHDQAPARTLLARGDQAGGQRAAVPA